jgi:hypothetical protein
MQGYAGHVRLQPAELDALPAMIREHGVILGCWYLLHGYVSLPDLVATLDTERDASERIADRARACWQQWT